ncbi:MAG: HAMP domain-containing histidine kinase, partial [Oscillospiraceae bacterium]|nr:HAMP domain-containing histidine kinase [Oscillospiraceae bacterium]
DRFYTVESAQHSTGLGLAIAKTVMEQMGGSITAHVEENLLSIVLRLPELKEESPAGTDPAAESPDARSMPPRQDSTI